jgi:hypothetical protein
MKNVSGGCLCGTVRYRIDGEPAMVAICHCSTCQKNTGSAFSTNVAFPTDAVEVSGDSLVSYEERANAHSVPFYRSFCSHCGSPISGHGKAYPGIVFIKAGTLDDPSWVRPTMHMWCTEKQPWVTLDHSTPELPAGPGS